MGTPLTIQTADDKRLKLLKSKLKLSSKVDVLRKALDLLESQLVRQSKIARWKRAAQRVSAHSRAINKEFQKNPLLKKIP